MNHLSLSSAVPNSASIDANDHFQAYLNYLNCRNGSNFELRDQRMLRIFDHSPLRSEVLIDSDRFNRNYKRFAETDSFIFKPIFTRLSDRSFNCKSII